MSKIFFQHECDLLYVLIHILKFVGAQIAEKKLSCQDHIFLPFMQQMVLTNQRLLIGKNYKKTTFYDIIYERLALKKPDQLAVAPGNITGI